MNREWGGNWQGTTVIPILLDKQQPTKKHIYHDPRNK